MVRPRADNYEERRQEILDAAAAMFAGRGFDGASIASIASACGVSKSLLYHYYPSKEALLYDMLHSHCLLLVETACGASHKDDPPETQLRDVVRALLALYMTSRDKHVALLNNLHCLPAAEQTTIRALEKRVVQVIRDLLARLRPGMSEPELTACAMYLMGAINWTYTWFKPRGAISPSHFADLASSVFLDGVRAR